MQRIADQVNKGVDKHWLFIDLVSAYDNVVHAQMIEMMGRRIRNQNS